MNILNKVTLQCLKKNKVRTIVTIIGIILSTAMFTAVTTSISSFENYLLQSVTEREGAWEALVYDMPEEAWEELASNQEIKDSVVFAQHGYLKINDLVINGAESQETMNKNKPYLLMESVASGDASLVGLALVSGRMPEAENEIIIPAHLITNAKLSLKEGDTLAGKLGCRQFDGVTLGLTDSLITEEESGRDAEQFVEMGEEVCYTIVGIYERLNYSIEPYYSPGYLVISGESGKSAPAYHMAFTVRHPAGLFEFLDSSAEGYRYDWHSDLLRINGVARQDSYRTVYLGLGIILAAIIMFGSVALIYNAFSISVNERIKQFGLLSSIGATKKQLKHSVIFEACSVSLIGIPCGVLAGMAGMGVTFYLLRDSFRGLINDSTVPLRLHVQPWAVIVAILLAFCTVLVSAGIPARKAVKIPAIEAIRQNREIRCSPEKGRFQGFGFLYRLFGLEGLLADKNFKRNRKKYRATVISLFVSIVLFISASSFVDYLKLGVGDVVQTNNYDIIYYLDWDTPGVDMGSLTGQMEALDAVDQVVFEQMVYKNISLKEEALSQSFRNYTSNRSQKDYVGEGNWGISLQFVFMEDDAYQEYLKSQGLEGQGYFSSRQEALVFDRYLIMEDEQYQTIHALAAKEGALEFEEYDVEYLEYDLDGDGNPSAAIMPPEEKEEGSYVYMERDGRPCRVWFREKRTLDYYVLDKEYPIGLNNGNVYFVYPRSAFPEFFSEDSYRRGNFCIVAEDSVKAYEELQKLLFQNGLEDGRLYNLDENQIFEENLLLVINVFSYGFIVLISLIAAANVFNTISTNISLRRREFAMLESIGMTKKGLYRMLNYECVLYGAKSILYGLPVSALVTYMIYQVVDVGYQVAFYIPAASVGIAVVSVFLVVFATMFYAAGKLKKSSVVETLKDENV